MEKAKRLFSQQVIVTRTEDERGFVTYVADAPWGRTRATLKDCRYYAEFYDLNAKAHGLESAGSEITFNALDESWQTQPAFELPTTQPDRNYAGYDYLAVDEGKLVAYKHDNNDRVIKLGLIIENYEQFLHVLAANDQHVLFSSSVDFPEEGTDNPAVIALCNRIRG